MLWSSGKIKMQIWQKINRFDRMWKYHVRSFVVHLLKIRKLQTRVREIIVWSHAIKQKILLIRLNKGLCYNWPSRWVWTSLPNSFSHFAPLFWVRKIKMLIIRIIWFILSFRLKSNNDAKFFDFFHFCNDLQIDFDWIMGQIKHS